MTPRPNSLLPSLGLAALFLTGCHQATPPSAPPATQSPNQIAAAANQAFLSQKTFDPWRLKTGNPNLINIPLYYSNGEGSWLIMPDGDFKVGYTTGIYKGGILEQQVYNDYEFPPVNPEDPDQHRINFNQQDIDLKTGIVSQVWPHYMSIPISCTMNYQRKWQQIWQTSDIIIGGDPEAQQVTHANMFYLLSSTFPGSTWSIPPMGLSSNVYGGHIFWDADVWMLPALIVQHADYAKPIVDYRFKLLAQARKNAQAHGYAGAEYPWESADTGRKKRRVTLRRSGTSPPMSPLPHGSGICGRAITPT